MAERVVKESVAAMDDTENMTEIKVDGTLWKNFSEMAVTERVAEGTVTQNIDKGVVTKNKTEEALTERETKKDQDISYGVENEYRMALIGKTGAGKSATGNTILGRKDGFISSLCGSSVTKQCKFETAERFGKKWVVVDTPGLFDTSSLNEKTTKEIVKCIGILSPGPHAFILVVQLGRFTQEEQNTVEHFSEIFGEEFFRYLIILFTHKDSLENEEKTIHEYVETVPDELKTILQRCGRKYVAFDNTPRGRKTGEDTRELMKMMEAISNETGQSYYTDVIFEEAEREFKRRAEELRLEEQQKIEEERKMIQDKIKAEHTEIENAKFKAKMLELKKQEEELKGKDEKFRQVYRKECESGFIDRLYEGVGSAANAVGSAVVTVGSAVGAVGSAVKGWFFGK